MTFYKVLQVPVTATDDEIRRSYKRLVVQLHPDKGGDIIKFRLVQKAYEVLRDGGARTAYNASLREHRRKKSVRTPPAHETVRHPYRGVLENGAEYVFETAPDRLKSRFRHGDILQNGDGKHGTFVGMAGDGQMYWTVYDTEFATPLFAFGMDTDVYIVQRAATTTPSSVARRASATESQRKARDEIRETLERRKQRQEFAAARNRVLEVEWARREDLLAFEERTLQDLLAHHAETRPRREGSEGRRSRPTVGAGVPALNLGRPTAGAQRCNTPREAATAPKPGVPRFSRSSTTTTVPRPAARATPTRTSRPPPPYVPREEGVKRVPAAERVRPWRTGVGAKPTPPTSPVWPRSPAPEGGRATAQPFERRSRTSTVRSATPLRSATPTPTQPRPAQPRPHQAAAAASRPTVRPLGGRVSGVRRGSDVPTTTAARYVDPSTPTNAGGPAGRTRPPDFPQRVATPPRLTRPSGRAA